jgi:hypothetical protein
MAGFTDHIEVGGFKWKSICQLTITPGFGSQKSDPLFEASEQIRGVSIPELFILRLIGCLSAWWRISPL